MDVIRGGIEMNKTAFCVAGEDKLKRYHILPQKILWKSKGVSEEQYLLQAEADYIYLGMKQRTRLSSENGKKGAVLLDFGSELAGGVELMVYRTSNSNGVNVKLRFGESVSEAMTSVSEKGATNDHAPRDMTVKVMNWSQQTWGNTGYRFVYIELAEEEAWVDFVGVRGVLTIRDIPYLGTFECDNKTLEKIYNVCAYTVHLNMQTMLWDGIKRDRLVWIGDAHPEMLAIRTVFGENETVEDALRFVPQTNKLPDTPNKHTTYGFWYLMILWDWYWYTGNQQLVIDLKEYWMGLTELLIQLIHEDREELLNEEEFVCGFFIDWPTKGTPEATAGVYALFRLALLATAKLCAQVGEEKLRIKCEYSANVLRQKKFDAKEKKQIVALLELADMADKKEAAEALVKDGGRGMSTFLSYYILSAVTETSGVKNALEMLNEYYGAMLDAGATTFWEDFDLEWAREGARIDTLLEEGEYDIHGDNGRFCYQGLRHSLCHGWSAGPAAFLAEKVMGIEILEAGCKKMSINPKLGNLKWIKGTYPTPHGVIKVEAWKEENETLVNVQAPQGIEIIK